MSNEPLDLDTIIRDHESKHFCPRSTRRIVWDPIVLGECLPYRLAELAQEQASALAIAQQLVADRFRVYRDAISWAATALESSNDRGDRYCAVQLRNALVDAQAEPEEVQS